LGVSKGSLYYRPVSEDKGTLQIMDELDLQYLKTPFYGSRRMTAHLQRSGFCLNRKKVQRLMHKMGMEAIYPKPNLSKSCPLHKKYPYLLRGVKITKVNQVWSTDITYIRLQVGFVYLVAILDWYSRYVLSWRLSNSLDALFCLDCLEESFTKGKPLIFNTDQGIVDSKNRLVTCSTE